MVEWGQRTSALADSFDAAAEMFAGRVRSRGALLGGLLLPALLVVVIALVGFFAIAMFMPLISLIQKLSGGH